MALANSFYFIRSQRGQEIKVSLKDRIAALGLDGRAPSNPNPSSTSASLTSNYAPYSLSSGSTPLAGVRDKAARFESIGGVPVPRGSFGLGAPNTFPGQRKVGELYGNRIPSAGSRSPGSSPGKALIDDEFGTDAQPRYISRRLSSAGSFHLDDTEEPVPSTKIEIVPPTPSFPLPTFADDQRKYSENNTQNESLVTTPSRLLAKSTGTGGSATATHAVASDVEPETSPSNETSSLSRSQELGTIPESPATPQFPDTAEAAEAASTTTSRRKFAIQKPEPLSRRTSNASSISKVISSPGAATQEVILSPPTRSATLSSSSNTPRRTKSQSSRDSESGSVTNGVFTSPPPDQGEISGGGSPCSPTMASLDDHDPFTRGLGSPVEAGARSIVQEDYRLNSPATPSVYSQDGFSPNDPNSSFLPTGTAVVYPNQELNFVPEANSYVNGASETLSTRDHSNSPSAIASPRQGPQPPNNGTPKAPVSSEPNIETASPARIMRELRQLGMEKQIVIPSPRRSSILAVLSPTFQTEPSKPEVSNISEESETITKPKVETKTTMTVLRVYRGEPSPTPRESSPITNSAHLREKSDYLQNSPVAASIVSNPPSSSGASDASYGRPSFASSRPDSADYSNSIVISPPQLPPTLTMPKKGATPAPTLPNFPFPSSETTPNPSRAMTPSPPPSFRSLYASGRLPPSSRGPGPHMPTGKIPLIKRAVTLMSRALPPIPREELPKRSTSAFHAIRSRTSSRASKHRDASIDGVDRASTSSDATITDNHSQRQGSTSSGSSQSKTTGSFLARDPYENIPPIVVMDSDPSITPIARRFMKNGSSKEVDQTARPPSSYRSGSPTPSSSSAQASISSCGPPVHLFSPSFDQGIFDAFPDVPRHFPSQTVVARHLKARESVDSGRVSLGMNPNYSFSELETMRAEDTRPPPPSPCKSEDGRASTRKLRAPEDVNEFGLSDVRDGQSPMRRRTNSRKLIPGWLDDDEEGEAETGWASVSIVRRRIA